MTEVERILHKELCRKSLYDFVKEFWNTCEPAKMVDGKLIQIYCEFFQYKCEQWTGDENIAKKEIVLPEKTDDIDIIDVRDGKKNLNVNVPPRHTKSLIFNVFGPTWLWLSHPIKAVSVSHTGGLAGEMNSKRYAIINSEKFKLFFPDIYLLANTAGFLKDVRGGELRSLNRNSFTGYGGDIIINDDLTSAETARKDKAEMSNAWNYYQNTMPSRINDIEHCLIMNIQQRLAPNDITGHIQADAALSAEYTHVVLPAIFEKDTYVVCPISGDVIVFKKGDPLWPERFGNYDSVRVQVGEAVFQTQYLQKAIATDKTVVKPEMIIEKPITLCPKITEADMIYASHDFPVKDKDSSDFLGSVLAYKVGSTLYIKDCLEKKMAFVRSVQYVKQLDALYNGVIQVIEDKANGSPILQQLQDEIAGLQAYQPGTASKMQRLESATLYMEAKNVVFVQSEYDPLTKKYHLSKALEKLKRRLLDFPFVEHDDIVDAFSQLLLFVFMDRRYMVYGRAFNDENICRVADVHNLANRTVFFNKEGDVWKVCEIAVKYGVESVLYVTREQRFKASVEEGIDKLKQFAPNKHVFIDCSATEALRGIVGKGVTVERYTEEDFDRSIAKANLGFAKNQIKIDESCTLTKGDIESFKFSKSKDESVKYRTTKDGFVACIRIALKYNGGIVRA